jgi:hypothetical protein
MDFVYEKDIAFLKRGQKRGDDPGLLNRRTRGRL